MKCTVCRGPAIIDIRRHNAKFCTEHFLKLCRDQVAKRPSRSSRCSKPATVYSSPVSGGKDSLGLWDLLLDLGYQADGLYLGLGIGDYSDSSGEYARASPMRADCTSSRSTSATTTASTYRTEPRPRRVPCSACGLTKRHLFDKAAIDGNYDAIATGHNLDDEAAVLFGNVLHWHEEYLGRQHPLLPARNGFPKKVKPLVRLGEREMAAYCLLRGIDYIVEECPMADGNRHLRYKAVLNELELTTPGAKADFFFGFLARGADHFAVPAGDDTLRLCDRCGAPSSGEVCAFCRLTDERSRSTNTAQSTQSTPVTFVGRDRHVPQ